MSKRQKPVRYWPGKAPKGAEEAQTSDDEEDQQEIRQQQRERRQSISEVKAYTEISVAPIPIDPSTDRRLARLQQRKAARDDEDMDEESRRAARAERTRRARMEEEEEAERHYSDSRVKEEEGQEDEEEEDEDAAAARRGRLRRKVLERRRAEEEAILAQEQEAAKQEEDVKEEEEDSDEYTSEYTTDSEEEAGPLRTLAKPVFVPKQHRETIFEKERLEKEAEEAEQKRLQQEEERIKDSQKMVEEELRREVAAAEISAAITDVDDTDNLDEDAEFAAWKLRELLRIKRDRAEKHAREQEKADLERRRLMTDEEIARENERLGIKQTSKEKSQMRFMQKYFHKGAFYNDDGDVGKALQEREFTAPTLEDKFDKSSLPAVMQVKNFGRAGQTKYTHLADQDTTSVSVTY
ncbi:Microfibrillar-associated protein 1 [Rhizophlyctis rosea]|nr:Microfibrillar-associated protein 1 [Rhizophlyctis rosea]